MPALAFGIDAEGHDALEEREEQVVQRENDAHEGGGADQLGEELARPVCEEAGGEAAKGKRAFAQPVPRFTGQVQDVARAAGQVAGEGRAHDGVEDGAASHNGQLAAAPGS